MSDAPMFMVDSEVQHVRTGFIYRIVLGPARLKIEATAEPAYAYEAVGGGTVWVRPQAEMEDGRFVLHSVGFAKRRPC